MERMAKAVVLLGVLAGCSPTVQKPNWEPLASASLTGADQEGPITLAKVVGPETALGKSSQKSSHISNKIPVDTVSGSRWIGPEMVQALAANTQPVFTQSAPGSGDGVKETTTASKPRKPEDHASAPPKPVATVSSSSAKATSSSESPSVSQVVPKRPVDEVAQNPVTLSAPAASIIPTSVPLPEAGTKLRVIAGSVTPVSEEQLYSSPVRGPTLASARSFKAEEIGPELVPSPKLISATADVTQGPIRAKSVPLGAKVRLVNSKRINLDYQVKDVGPSGISEVELWYSQGSRSWQKYPGTPQHTSPYVVEVEEEDLYGFTLVGRSGAGISRQPPQPGEVPQVWVEVDVTKPTVRLLGVEGAPGGRAGMLVSTWKAADKNLAPHPITISYSAQSNGPWIALASGLENTGQATCPMPAGMPGRFFVRVEAVDRVGNIGSAQTPTPILGDMSEPSIAILDVTPASH